MKLYGRKSYSFEFENEDDRAQALEMGNFHIASQLFLVRPWKLFVEADLKNMETLPIWVLFKKVPEELRDDDGYSRIASAIGEPLFTDRKTEMKANPEYARICIEVKASSSFPKMVPVVVDKRRVFHIDVEYNWKPPNCKHCKVFGHNEQNCSRAPKSTIWVQKAQDKGKLTAEGTSNENGEGAMAGAPEKQIEQGKEKGPPREGTIESEAIGEPTSVGNGEIGEHSEKWITPGKNQTFRRTKSPGRVGQRMVTTVSYDKEGHNQKEVGRGLVGGAGGVRRSTRISSPPPPAKESKGADNEASSISDSDNEENKEIELEQARRSVLDKEIALVQARRKQLKEGVPLSSKKGGKKNKAAWMNQRTTPPITREDDEPLINFLMDVQKG
ncbi:hypothetical protein ACHQM5_016544 [Ranunculus cassubicifolius]